MRPLLAAMLRLLMHVVAVLFTPVSSVIIARRLPVEDYALYQTIARRLEVYAILPAFIARFWAYRYISMGVRGSWPAYLLVLTATSLLGTVVGIGLALYYGRWELAVLVLAGAYGFLRILATRLVDVLEAFRPVRAELVILLQRGLFAALVAVTLYLAVMPGVVGALFSATAAMLVSMVLVLYSSRARLGEGVCRRCIREWFSKEGVLLPLVMWIAVLLYGLDAVYARWIAGAETVAGFFAAISFSMLVQEVASAATRHVYAFLLGGGDTRTALVAWRAVLAATAPILGYMAARPEAVIALLNPVYTYASQALQVHTIAMLTLSFSLVLMQLLQGLDRTREPRLQGGVWAATVSHMVSAIVFTVLMPPLLYAARGSPATAATAWASALLAAYTVRLTLLSWYARGSLGLVARSLILPVSAYYTLSLTLAHIVAPPGFEERFWNNLVLVVEGLAYTIAPYTAVVLVADATLRELARRLIHQAIRALWRRL